jgi:hypothetical protein
MTQRRNVERLRAVGAIIRYYFEMEEVAGETRYNPKLPQPDNLLVRHYGVEGACRVNGVYARDMFGLTPEFTDADMRQLAPFKDIQWVDIRSRSVTDEGAEVLANLPNLETIWLRSPDITDRTVERLVLYNRKLTTVFLHNTSITDRSVQALASLPNLKTLVVRRTNVTGECIASICQIRGLVQLDISGLPIGEGRLAALRSLPQLKLVVVTDTGVSEQDVLELTAGRPGLKVYR